eukprot:TRINITY_DN322_c0_g2_i7.p2 TRINITY_DN322_c0_g2~~TRINITY_DN322_c0_g2_i7.p2  ORF type:complete len:199 (+),score=14.89 TRINITY_DN322_c0_g2_i7:598-1194(+)
MQPAVAKAIAYISPSTMLANARASAQLTAVALAVATAFFVCVWNPEPEPSAKSRATYSTATQRSFSTVEASRSTFYYELPYQAAANPLEIAVTVALATAIALALPNPMAQHPTSAETMSAFTDASAYATTSKTRVLFDFFVLFSDSFTNSCHSSLFICNSKIIIGLNYCFSSGTPIPLTHKHTLKFANRGKLAPNKTS